MRVIALLIAAFLLAGCTSDSDPAPETEPGGEAEPSGDDGAAGNETSEPQSGESGAPGRDGMGAQQCADEATTETLWELPSDYDPAGDSGSVDIEWTDRIVKFRATWGELRSGSFAISVIANGTEIWSASGSGGHLTASPGAGPQSGEQRVFHDIRLEWSADGVNEGLTVEIEYRPCTDS